MVFVNGSRYGNLPRFETDENGGGFKGVMPRALPVATPVLEHSVALKERLDQLAFNFYRNPRDWPRLAEANPKQIFAEYLLWGPEPARENGREKLGQVILVPRRREDGA